MNTFIFIIGPYGTQVAFRKTGKFRLSFHRDRLFLRKLHVELAAAQNCVTMQKVIERIAEN